MKIDTILKCIIICDPAVNEHTQIRNTTHIRYCSRRTAEYTGALINSIKTRLSSSTEVSFVIIVRTKHIEIFFNIIRLSVKILG